MRQKTQCRSSDGTCHELQQSTRYRFLSSPKPFTEIDPGTFYCIKCITRNDSVMTSFMSPTTVPTQSNFDYLKDAIPLHATGASSVRARNLASRGA